MTFSKHPSTTVLCCLAALAVLSIGCKKEKPAEPVVEDTSGYEAPAPEPEVEYEPPPEACMLETVYFALDSSELDSSARASIARAVECFRNQSSSGRLLLTGAADPRGTEEYNLALGERRAKSVRKYLKSLGLDANRVSITSVGEEMATGTDESGWARDRNVSASEAN